MAFTGKCDTSKRTEKRRFASCQISSLPIQHDSDSSALQKIQERLAESAHPPYAWTHRDRTMRMDMHNGLTMDADADKSIDTDIDGAVLSGAPLSINNQTGCED